jgi:hypothetical protein
MSIIFLKTNSDFKGQVCFMTEWLYPKKMKIKKFNYFFKKEMKQINFPYLKGPMTNSLGFFKFQKLHWSLPLGGGPKNTLKKRASYLLSKMAPTIKFSTQRDVSPFLMHFPIWMQQLVFAYEHFLLHYEITHKCLSFSYYWDLLLHKPHVIIVKFG